MWPGLLVVTVVPVLALLVIADAVVPISRAVAKIFHVATQELALLMLLVAVVCILAVALDLNFNDVFLINGWLVQYTTDEAARSWADRMIIENRIFIADLLAIFVSVPVVIRMALRRGRSPIIWLPIALLGNVGAIVWLARNGSAREAAGEKPA